MPTISKTSFVIAVPDLKSSAAFYRDVLGLTIHTISDPGWLFYISGDCTIMAGHCPDAIPPRKLGDHSYFAYLEIDALEAQEIKETGRCEAALVPWAYQENDPEQVLSGSIPSH